MQICALHTEVGFQMGFLILNLRVTYFFNYDFHWLLCTTEIGLLLLFGLLLLPTGDGRHLLAESCEMFVFSR